MAISGTSIAVPGGGPSLPHLPLPVLAIGAGALLGGIVFIANRARGAQVTGAQGTPQQILPSVPIMLGSLQQSILDLQGQVGSGIGGLTDQVSNEQTALAQNIGSATSSITQNITDAQAAINSHTDTTAQAYTDLLNAKANALTNTINNLGTQIASIGVGQDALKSQLQDAQAALSQELGGVSSTLTSVSSNVQSLQTGQANIGSQLTGVGGQLSAQASQIAQSAQQLYYNELATQYLGLANTTAVSSPLGRNDPRILQWQRLASNMAALAAGQPVPYPADASGFLTGPPSQQPVV